MTARSPMLRASMLLGLTLVLSSPTLAAYAEAGASIRSVGGVDGRLQIVLSGVDLAGRSLDPSTVAVTLDGRPTPATATALAAAKDAALSRRVVLAFDTSGSMAGSGIAGAKQAASAYLRSVPKDVAVGLVTFSDRAQVVVAPTTDRAAVARVIPALAAKGETALFDGVGVALRALGPAGLRSVVLLSDGADTVSVTKLPSLLLALKKSGVRLDAVGFRTDATVASTLQQMVGTTGGRVLGAGSAAALAEAFRNAAITLNSDLVVTADVPADLAGRQASVKVSVRSAGAVLSDEVVTILPAAVTPTSSALVSPALRPAATGGLGGSADTLAWGLAACFLAIVSIVLLVAGPLGRKERAGGRQRRLLSLYTLTGRPAPVREEGRVLGDSQIAQSALELAGRYARRRGLEERLALKLDAAAMPLRPAEWLLLVVGTSAAALLLLLLLSGNAVGALVGAGLGALVPGRWLSFKARRRQGAFEDAMPDALQLLAGSLSAGFSLPQAIDAVAREGAEPIAGEFGRAVAEARIGVPVEDSLENIAERMHSENFHWVVMAVRTQREVGGNLAEVLTIVAQTMRDRAKLQRQVRALSAEGRLSAYVLIGLPVGMALYLFTFRRSYMAPLYSQLIGIIMIVAAVILLGIGILWMRKIIKVEV